MKNLISISLVAIFLFVGCAEESKKNPKNLEEAASRTKDLIDQLDEKAGDKVKDLFKDKDQTVGKAKDLIDRFSEKNGEKADELLKNKEEKLDKAKEILNKLGKDQKDGNGIETDLEDLLDLFGKEDGNKAKDWLKNNNGKVDQVRNVLDSLAKNSGDLKELVNKNKDKWLEKIGGLKDDPQVKERLHKLEGAAKDLLNKFDKIVQESTKEKP